MGAGSAISYLAEVVSDLKQPHNNRDKPPFFLLLGIFSSQISEFISPLVLNVIF